MLPRNNEGVKIEQNRLKKSCSERQIREMEEEQLFPLPADIGK